MNDVYPETGRTYDVEAAIRVIQSERFEIDKLGKDWSMMDFGVAIVEEYKRLIDETL